MLGEARGNIVGEMGNEVEEGVRNRLGAAAHHDGVDSRSLLPAFAGTGPAGMTSGESGTIGRRAHMKQNPQDNFRSVQGARVQVLPSSCHHDEHLSSPSVSVRRSVIPAFSLVIPAFSLVTSVASLVIPASPPVIPASPPVIPAKAGIHSGRCSAPPTTTDLPDYV